MRFLIVAIDTGAYLINLNFKYVICTENIRYIYINDGKSK